MELYFPKVKCYSKLSGSLPNADEPWRCHKNGRWVDGEKTEIICQGPRKGKKAKNKSEKIEEKKAKKKSKLNARHERKTERESRLMTKNISSFAGNLVRMT